MPHGFLRSLMWWVPTISFTLQRESGALLVEVMICLIQVPQIIALWVSGGPVRRKHGNHKIHLTIIVHRPIPPWLLDNAEFQRVADDCFDLWFALQKQWVRWFVVLCWYNVCLCIHISYYPCHRCHYSTSKAGVSVNNNAVAGASSN